MFEMQQEDEAIISASNQVQATQPKPSVLPRRGAERTLEKTSWVSGPATTNLANLDSLDDGSDH